MPRRIPALALLALAAATNPRCANQHPECDNWARQGECAKNPGYMEKSCAEACNVDCTKARDCFGFEIDLYGDEMTDHDRDTFANNLRINQHQPPTVPQFTELGHKLVRIPEPLRSQLFQHRQLMLDRDLLRREGCTRGYLNNCGRHHTLTMPLDRDLTREINRATAEVLEDWIGREKWGSLVHTSTYGIRRYTNGSTLQAHVDVVATHAVSAILNVGQDVDSDWPLQIMGHDGTAHSVIMAPGEMVLYESAKAIHARMIPLNGTSYDNVFVHFRPSKGWERFVDVPNGGVVADHVEL